MKDEDDPASEWDVAMQGQAFAVALATLLETLEERDPGVRAAFDLKLDAVIAALDAHVAADWSQGRVSDFLKGIRVFTGRKKSKTSRPSSKKV